MKKLILPVVLALAAALPLATRAGHFAWGAEVGSGIDVTGCDMSTIDFGVAAGYANSWIDILGVSAGVNMMMSNSSRYFPLTAILRTSFTSRPSRWFADLRTGVAINNIYDRGSQAGFYVAPGLGFYLARGKTFASYVSLHYIYNDADCQAQSPDQWTLKHGIQQIAVRIGVNF